VDVNVLVNVDVKVGVFVFVNVDVGVKVCVYVLVTERVNVGVIVLVNVGSTVGDGVPVYIIYATWFVKPKSLSPTFCTPVGVTVGVAVYVGVGAVTFISTHILLLVPIDGFK
jgi:hypothetical protein